MKIQPVAPEKRAEILAAIKAGTQSIDAAAEANAITPKTIRRWLRGPKAPTAAKSIAASTAASKEAPEMQRLRAENRRLRTMLGEILIEQQFAKGN